MAVPREAQPWRGRKPLTLERLREALRYNPETGEFFWRVSRPGRCARPGKRAGKLNKYRGYRSIKIDGRSYMEHRLAWFYRTGRWPANEIDHINGVRADNRFCNLREATRSQNRWNAKPHRHSRSPHKGISQTPNGKWRAEICVHGGHKHLGTFLTADAARDAYQAAATELHGEFRWSGG